MGAKKHLGRLTPLSLMLLAIVVSSGGPGLGQSDSNNPSIKEIVLAPPPNVESVSSASFLYIASSDVNILVQVTVANSGSDPVDFEISIRFRREDEDEAVFDDPDRERCQITCSGRLSAESTATSTGSIQQGDIEQGGRYIVRITLKSDGQLIEVRDMLLLVAITDPEYHPTSLRFTPPSPVLRGTQVTVAVEIENTGKPFAPVLDVTFEHCLPPDISGVCEEFSSAGFKEGTDGTVRVGTEETRPLAEGGSITVTNVLDTSGLMEGGTYVIRVTVQAADGNELDTANNEMTARLSITGEISPPSGPNLLCTLPGKAITLGRRPGTTAAGATDPEIIYVGVEEALGGDHFKVSLHAFRKADLDQLKGQEVVAPCPESLEPKVLSEDAQITAFAVDLMVRLLYVGLSNGELYIVDLDKTDTLKIRKNFISDAPVVGLATRFAGRGKDGTIKGQVFIGSEDGNLYRLTVIKGKVLTMARDTCGGVGNPIVQGSVSISGGLVYFAAGTAVYGMSDKACRQPGKLEPFTADSNITALSIATVRDDLDSLEDLDYTPYDRILVGTSFGTFYILNDFAEIEATVTMNWPITAVAINDSRRTSVEKREAAYVGTSIGTIHTVNLRDGSERCVPFSTGQLKPINVITVDSGSEDRFGSSSSGSGLVFAGSEDRNLYVIDGDTCKRFKEPQPTRGPVRANIILKAKAGVFGFSVEVLYGGGVGLYEAEVQP